MHVLDGWMLATKTRLARNIHEDGMWVPPWLEWKMVTYTKISPKMLNARDIAGNSEEESKDVGMTEMTIVCTLCQIQRLKECTETCWRSGSPWMTPCLKPSLWTPPRRLSCFLIGSNCAWFAHLNPDWSMQVGFCLFVCLLGFFFNTADWNDGAVVVYINCRSVNVISTYHQMHGSVTEFAMVQCIDNI